MYVPPIEVQMTNMHLIAKKSAEDGVVEALWNMGFKVDAEQLTCALVQDKKRYETAYDKGWNDCKELYEAKLKKIADFLEEQR